MIQDEFGLYQYEFEDGKFILLDFEDKTVKLKKVNNGRKNKKFSYSTIISAVPKNYNRNRDVFMNKYTHIITWESLFEKYPFTTNDDIKETKNILENKNYVIQHLLLNTVLSSITMIMHNKKLFKDSEDIETTEF